MTKADYYESLKQEIAINWTEDWAVYAEKDWELIRAIDAWLLEVCDHPGVSLEEYQAQGERLRALYVDGKTFLGVHS